MARKTTAKSAHTEAITRDVKERGHSMLTGAWNSSAHTIQNVRKSEKRWSGDGESWKESGETKSKINLCYIFGSLRMKACYFSNEKWGYVFY